MLINSKNCPFCNSEHIVTDYSKKSGKSCLRCNSEIRTQSDDDYPMYDVDLEDVYTENYDKMIVENKDGWLRNRSGNK